MQAIIDQLRDDHEYYRGMGKMYLSNSDIGTLLSNPKQFRAEREDTKHFQEGRLFHQLLIEPAKAESVVHVDVSTRNTKEYKKFLEEKGIEFALLTKEVEDVKKLVSVMKSNISFYYDIYAEGNLYEEPMIGKVQGTDFKGKADIVGKDFIIDLKTTSDINKFKYTAKLYNYDSQCYIYQELFNKPLLFYVIDKETAQLGIFRPTENFIKGGELKVERALKVYEMYYGINKWENIENHFIYDNLE
jgi:hypothetical protein